MKTIAMTGATGFIGSSIRMMNSDRYTFVPIKRADVDLSNPKAAAEYVEKMDFDIFFHAAANPSTADCEAHPEETHRLNAETPIAIAGICEKRGKRFVFLSTEQIYNGKSVPGPFEEEEPPETVTKYGEHKAEVEQWLRENGKTYLVLRLSTMFGMAMPGVVPSPNPLKNTLNALWEKEETLFTVNELRGMTYVQRLAAQFDKLMELPSGTYNLASENHRTTYEVALYIAKQFGYSQEEIDRYIKPNYERYRERFRDYRLSSAKLRGAGIEMGSFESDLEMCMRDFGWTKKQ